MSLTRNLEQAFLNNKYGESVDINSLPAVETTNISILAEDMANAIADFITAQTFKITRMIADVEMNEIKTTAPIQGEMLDVQTTVSTTVTGASATGGPVTATGTGAGTGKTTPVRVGITPGKGLVLQKKPGGQGGMMISAGKATVGRPGIVDFNTETEVKLDPNDIQKI